MLACLLLCGCGKGREHLVKDRTYDQVWSAALEELKIENPGFWVGTYDVRECMEDGELLGGSTGEVFGNGSLTLVDLKQQKDGVALLVRERRYHARHEGNFLLPHLFFHYDEEEAERILQAILHRLGVTEKP